MRGRSEFFATCPPGLARLLRDRLAATTGVEVTASGSDGEADCVLYDADRDGRVRAAGLRLADGVFATASRARRNGSTDPAALADRCWPREGVQRALSLWAEQVRPLSPAMTFRVTARMRTGPRSLRTGLRAALADAIRRDRPRWRPSGQGELEVLLSELRAGELVTGLRVAGNRPTTVSGLPSALAAAMVALAGPPGGVLLDPACGHGEILTEAAAAGWTAEGESAGHASEILEPDDSVDACVTSLALDPAAALAEMSRVTRSGGAVVVLAAEVPEYPPALRLRRQVPVRLGSGRQVIWVFRRA